MKTKGYRIAHFSDWHINDAGQCRKAVDMIRDAVKRGASHIAITGDLLGRADMRLAEAFWKSLKSIGMAEADSCTVVPGNHDLFAVSDDWFPDEKANLTERLLHYGRALRASAKVLKQSADVARTRLDTITRSSRSGDNTTQLCKDHAFTVGKTLADGNIVIAAVDTVRDWSLDFRHWQEGELRACCMQAVKRFFAKHKNARHKLLTMHHSPFEENCIGPFCQLFTKPSPAHVMKWITACGATQVLCGHIHEARSVRDESLSRTCRILRAGTAGGIYDKRRVYHLIDFTATCSGTVKRVRFTP